MRLADCNASFFGRMGPAPDGGPAVEQKGVGLIFDCPLCVLEGRPDVDRHGIVIHFKTALDGSPVPQDVRRWKEKVKDAGGNEVEVVKELVIPQWDRTGTTLDDLTLSPSLNAEAQDHGEHRGWHGHVQQGRIVGGGVP